MTRLVLMGHSARAVLLLGCLTLGASVALAADQSKTQDKIQEMIEGLSVGIGSEDLTSIYEAISEVPDASTRQDLRAALHAKLDELFDPTRRSSEVIAGDESVVTPPLPEGDEPFRKALEMQATRVRLQSQIETLELGPQASTDTIRLRDDLVAEISQLSNPDLRNELLQLLEERERTADTGVTSTVN